MPRSRKRRHDEREYHELKKKLKKLVKRRSRSRSRRRRYESSSQESWRDRSRSASSRSDYERYYTAREHHERLPRGRGRRDRTRDRSRSRSRRRNPSRYRSRTRRSYSSESRCASETEDAKKPSSDVDDSTNKDHTTDVETSTVAAITTQAAGETSGNSPFISVPAENIVPTSVVAATISGPAERTTSGPAASTDAGVEPLITEVELDSDILEIFGEDPTQTKNYGSEIQKDLAVRLEHMTVNGLSKDTRKELKEKYLVPSNCKLIDAPTLNPEIKAAVSEAVAKRDKAIEARQKQVACVISCLSQAITKVISAKEKDTELVKLLMHAEQLLCDTQHCDSSTRRSFVLTSVKKDVKEQLENTKPDNFLFGQNLSETLKTAKAINKSGAELKVSNAPKSVIKKPAPGPSKALNSRGPPARRQAGPPRTKEPAPPPPRNQRSKFSRPSQRRHQPFYHR